MSNTTARPTLASTNARLDGLEISVAAIMTHLGIPTSKAAEKAAEKAAPKARPTGARKTPNRKPVKGGVVEGARCLTKSNRQQFIADHDWAQPGMSTSALANAVLVDGQPLTGVWAIGPKRVALYTGNEAPVTGPAVGKVDKAASKAERKAAKKAAKKAAQQVLVQVEPEAPAKTLTPAQQARIDAPRDALGRVTPKAEWPLREALAETGKYDRKEIDAKVAEARAMDLIPA